ncbi:MAG: thiolase domain-containing protein [Betaproteobacteria bacterium]|nr:thiolase domain-containing protein [Betaproteobacteria bacterium]NCA16540.1 thiolase domain-containing protein [Betaproteobacteria bacterium]
MISPCIVGWGHTRFGKHTERSIPSLIEEAVTEALSRAALSPEDIDAIFLGHFNGGFVGQDFSAPLVGLAIPALRTTPACRLENACATGSAAIWAARDSVASGRVRRALVVGVEKMTERTSTEAGEILLRCSFTEEERSTPGGFAGIFARFAQAYFERYGDQSDALAHIAAKNHANGCSNPYAHFQKDLGLAFCKTASERNPYVAGPLKRSDCSPVTDGAAALVIANEARPSASVPAISWLSATQVNDSFPMSTRDLTQFGAARLAWQKGLRDARITLDDLSLVETHDCFTIAELMQYEAMGLCAAGEAARVACDGSTHKEGRLPVNPSGGLKSKGHPIGATGVSMHVMAAMQLSHMAGGMQVAKASRAAVFNMGGSGVANYLSVLQPL